MHLSEQFFALFAIIIVANGTQTATGFGNTIIGLALATHFRSIDSLLPLFVALDAVGSLLVVGRHRNDVDRTLLTRTLLPWMIAGVTVGVLVKPLIVGGLLKQLLGVLIGVLALDGVRRMVMHEPDEAPKAPNVFTRALITFSGVTFGIYATGGPLLVAALTRLKLDRKLQRATLLCVWLIFDLILLVVQCAQGAWTKERAFELLTLLPAAPLGTVVGEVVLKRMPERAFRYAVYALLIFAAVRLLIHS